MSITIKEEALDLKYYGKVVRYDRGAEKEPIYGRIERLGVESWKSPAIIRFQIGDIQYVEELDDFESLITLL